MTNRYPGVNRVGRAALLTFGLVFYATTQIGPTASGAEDARKISWREDLGQAQAEAKSRDMLLWIQFTGPWCGNCRRMDRSTFLSASVISESRDRFVPVKVRSDEYESLAQSLGLKGLPSTVIVRPNGEVVDKWEGYAEPEEFFSFLGVVLTREGRSPEQVAARSKAKFHQDSAIALAGYDPVSLLKEQKLVPGRADLTVEHEGHLFHFANEAGKATFLAKPETFAPVNGGRCPVSQVDRGDFQSGDPRWGVVYQSHLFLFKDVADRDRFAKDPERYSGLIHNGRSSCPHCQDRSTMARRLSSRFSTMFASQSSVASGVVPKALANSSSSTLSDRLASFLSFDSVLRR